MSTHDSCALAAALRFMGISGIEIKRSESFQNSPLLVTLNIFFECDRDSFLPGFMAADFPGLLDQLIVDCQVRGHV